MPPALSRKQRAFVDEYLIDLNASAAAVRAGYSAATAYSAGQRLLKKVEVAAALEAAMAERQARTQITADAVLQKLAAVAFTDVRELFRPDGALKSVGELNEVAAAALASFDVVTVISDNGSVTRTSKVRFNDRLRALELLGKHFGLFEPKGALGTAENPLAVLMRQAQGTALPVVENPLPDDEESDGAGWPRAA